MLQAKSLLENSELAGVFKAAGFLMSASVALVFGFLGPTRDARGHVQRLLTRVAALVTALATGLIWASYADPAHRALLASFAIGFGATTVLAFILYQQTLRTAQPRKLMLSGFYLILALSGPIALSSTALLVLLPKPIEVKLLAPQAGSCFAPDSLVEGEWQNLPADYDIWVAATKLDGRVFFPEDRKAIKLENGTWESSFGYTPPAGAKGFYIRVMLVNSEGRARFESYAHDTARMGLEELPAGVQVFDRIRMKMGEGCP
jgi:hypothetical protein